MKNHLQILILAICLAIGSPVLGEIAIKTPARTGEVDFNADILPLFKANCLACHSQSEAEGDLVLESADSVRNGGASGEAVVAGNSGESYLLRLAAHLDEPIMPPEDNDVGAENFTPEQLGLIKLWIDQGAKDGVASVASEVVFRPLPKTISPILAAVISADGRLAVCSRGNRIYVYEVASGKLIQELIDADLKLNDQETETAHLDLVQSLAIDAEGQWIASGGFRNIKLWKRVGRGEKKRMALPDTPSSLAVSPNGQLVAVSLVSGAISLIDVAENVVRRTLTGHRGKVNSLAFAGPDLLVATGVDKTIRVWNRKGEVVSETAVDHVAMSLCTVGERVATGHQDGVIRVWKINGDRLVLERELTGHAGSVIAMAKVPNRSNEAASGGTDGTARIWSLETGRQIRSFDHGAPLISLSVHRDGSRLLTTGENQLARLWGYESGKQIGSFQGDFRLAEKVAKMDRSLALMTTELEVAKAHIADLEKQQATRAEEAKKAREALPTAEKDLANKVSVVSEAKMAKTSVDQRLADIRASGAEIDKLVGLINANRDSSRMAADQLRAGFEATRKATGVPADGVAAKLSEVQKLIDAHRDQQRNALEQLVGKSEELKAAVKLEIENLKKEVDMTSKKLAEAEKAVQEAQRKLDQVTLNEKQRQQDYERSTAELTLANQEKDSQELQRKAHEAERNKIVEMESKSASRYVASCFPAKQGQLAILAEQGGIYLHDAETGTANDRLDGHDGRPLDVAWAGDQLISIGEDKQLIVWKTQLEWNLAKVLGSVDSPGPLSDRVLALDFSADGRMLVAGSGEPSRSGKVSIWNVADGTLIRSMDDAHSDTVYAVEFSPDDKQIATSAADRMAKVFNVADGSFVRGFEGHTHHVLDVAWQANGKSLATAGADNVIKIWNAATGEQKRTISGISKEVTSIAFAGISANTISSSGDTNIRIHKSGDGGVVRSMNGGGDFVYAAAVSDDGKHIVSGGVKSILHVWNADDGQLVKSLMPTE